MTKDFLFILKKSMDCNFSDFNMYIQNHDKELQKVYLEYIINNASDIVKTASKLLENMEKSDK